MKKTLFFGLIAASLGFTACSSEDDAILGEKTQTKGMVLNATVEQPAETRATIDNSAANWQFAFAEDDVIKVTNSAVTSGTYYTFTNDGTNFKSTDAETTATAADWYAYFPSNTINLTNQAGTMEGVANLYALAGATSSATTGESGLTIPMSAKVAILKIENSKGVIDIQVKTSATDFVTGLTAKSGEAGFDVSTSTTPTTLFTTSTTGDYYVAVPAGVQLSVKDGSTTIKSTGTNGLAAGKYYTLTLAAEPFTLTALEDGSTVSINYSSFQYRTSTQQDWTDYPYGTEISVNTGQSVQFRGKPTSTSTYVNTSFMMTAGSFDASGNVMSLLNGREMGEYAFYQLFYNCTNLKSASALLLPATTLTSRCYSRMFSGCSNLTAAPASLPATTLANYCYQSMFNGCSKLTTAPASLPATTLANYCYHGMFYGCKSLTAAPIISATTLAQYCCQNMFYNCTSLETAPTLPATTLANYCYASMFYGCTSLTAAPALPAENLAQNCYRQMFQGCSSLTAAPASLPATTMAANCYYQMFNGCTSLETAPTLPAITSGETQCLYRMFYGCSKLKSVTVNFTSWPSGTDATNFWLVNAGTAATGKTFTCPAALGTESTITRGENYCPDGWTVVNP